MPFGQVILGPPGSGKTTYCAGMQQFMRASGRPTAVINLDPANDQPPYAPDVDIADLVELESVMETLHLGPNGGLIYCMDYLEKNLDWLHEKLEPLIKANCYLLFDLPGQVELYMLHGGLRRIVEALTAKWSLRLVAMHLIDAHLCTEAAKYISALLLSLSTMLHLEMPHINVMSKIDLVRQYGKLDFNLDFYTEVQDLSYLVQSMGNSKFTAKYRKLSKGLCEVVEDFGLLSFEPMTIKDTDSMQRVLGAADKANGYVYASLAGQSPYPPEFVYGSAFQGSASDVWSTMQEKYVDGDTTAAASFEPGGIGIHERQQGGSAASASAAQVSIAEEPEQEEAAAGEEALLHGGDGEHADGLEQLRGAGVQGRGHGQAGADQGAGAGQAGRAQQQGSSEAGPLSGQQGASVPGSSEGGQDAK